MTAASRAAAIANRALAAANRALVLAARRPLLSVALLLALALALRIGEVQRTAYTPTGDAGSYVKLGGEVARLGDYSPRDLGAGGTIGPSAYFPPAYPYLLAAVDRLTGHSDAPASASAIHADRVLSALIGTVVVAFVGLVATELFGTQIALLALAIAAVYPVLIALSAVLVAENLLTAFELAAVYAALRVRRARDPLRWLVACGVLTGLAALTHVNAILLLVPLAFAVRGAAPALGRRFLWAPALLVGVAALTISPWLIRDAVELHGFVPISDESGITLRGTYNPTSATSTDPPWRWRLYLQIPADRKLARQAQSMTELALDHRLESRALSYIADHPAAPFDVALDNTLRLAELQGRTAWRISAASIGIPLGVAGVGVISFWVLALLAVAGALTRVGRRIPGPLWGVAFVMWTTAAFVNGETPRFREPLEPFVILLVACAIAALLRTAHGPRTAPPVEAAPATGAVRQGPAAP